MLRNNLRTRCLMLLAMLLVMVGCGTRPESTASSPIPATMTDTTTAAVAPSSAPATPDQATTTTESVATATLDLPTAAPTITAGPTATPFPLEAGWWDNAVCYEVFVRSFYDSNGDGVGDLNGLIEKLDYINDGAADKQQDLGATCIWLMPIAESPSYHGYDVVDYYNVDQEYGTNEDFKRLVEEAHKRGIKVVLDLVLNHTSVEHPWFQEALKDPNSQYRDWYLWSKDHPGYKGPWGDVAWHRSPAADEYYYGVFWEGMPDLNYRNPAVTEEAHKISAFWLDEMGADGFRLDAIKHVIENGRAQENTPETHAWLRDYRTYLEEIAPNAYTVGEIFGANPLTLKNYYPDQLDHYFVFEVGDKIIAAANSGLASAYTLTVANANNKLPFQRWAPFLTNHDQNRVMTTLGNDVGKAKIAATALLTLPGLPFVYYGEEIGMIGAKPDEDIRTPLQWSGEEQGGFTSGKPWRAFQKNYQEVNVAAQSDDPDSLLNLYRRLIHLHTNNPALAQGDFVPLKSSNGAVAAFLRQTDEQVILVVLNFGKNAVADVALSAEQSSLAAGEYQLQPLLNADSGPSLAVSDGGAFADFVPLPNLEAHTGYIFELTR